MGDLKPTDLKKCVAIGTRLRMTRKKDAKALYGWVKAVDRELIMIELCTKVELALGDQFFVEINGSGVRVLCDGILEQFTDGDTIRLLVIGQPRVLETDQQVRLQVDQFPGAMTVEDNRFPIRVVDVSPNGIGFLSESHARRGDVCRFEVKAPSGVIGFTAEIRYCRAIEVIEEAYKFRLGAQFQEIGRLDLARFLKLFDQAA